VHRQPWPDAAAFRPDGVDEVEVAQLERAAVVLAEVRKAKSAAKTSQRTPVTRLVLPGAAGLFAPYLEDLRNAAVVEGEIEYDEGAEASVPLVELGEAPAKVSR
jgi:valyl-tRNA synthetase